MNLVDFIIIIILITYGVIGYFRGFIKIFSDFLYLFISLFLAFLLNGKFSGILQNYISLSPGLLKVFSFLFLLLFFELIFSLLSYFLYAKLPEKIRSSIVNKVLGIPSSIIKGILVIAVVLTLIVALPTSSRIKDKALSSAIGKPLISYLSGIERKIEGSFGEAINETLTLLTIKPETEETVDLKFKITDVSVDEQSEKLMLDLVNKERVKRGLKILVVDNKLKEVARAHSRDMFAKGYFSHENLEGESPFDRMDKDGVKYIIAGENLALAPNVDLAHFGLMESPGHRANILNSEYGKIGIGVIDGGVYGKMFTQNFSD